MILLLDTSTPVCRLTLVDNERQYHDEWQADRGLAKGLLDYLDAQLKKNGKMFQDIKGIGAFRGPGSFTGLRIGLTVLNTLADSQHIPIVGGEDDNWQQAVLDRLKNGDNDRLVMPLYGAAATITKPRK